MDFEEILINRDKEIKECRELIECLNNSLDYVVDSKNKDILVSILKKKIGLYENLQYYNYKKISLSLQQTNQEIYHQIKILEKNNKIRKSLLKEHFDKYIKKIRDREFSNFTKNTFKKATKLFQNQFLVISISFFAGFMIFIPYFFKKYQYIPQIQGLEIFYLIVMLGIAGATYLFLFLLLPFACFGFIEMFFILYGQKIIKKDYFVMLTIIATVIIVFIVYVAADSKHINNILNIAILLIILAFLIPIFLKNKIKIDEKFEIIIASSLYFILAFLILVFAFLFSYDVLMVSLQDSELRLVVLVVYFSLLIFIYIVLTIIKNIYVFRVVVFLFTLFNFFILLPVLNLEIVKKLNFGNINYSSITLSKEAKEHLPRDIICETDCGNFSCWIDENDKIICKNLDIEIISYVDGNLTYAYKKDTDKKHSLSDISKRCIKFVDENNTKIDTKGKKIKFIEGNLTFINKDGEDKPKEKIKAITTPETCLTYMEELENNATKLYNIKAISTLGKYWYIETMSGDRFEIESSFIKSKVRKE
ncbi:MAG: hypothetical protein GX282_05010 [Campylobacteraceae bacterium]|nr:hypothetical protein [Campylobacteraceae bacterium]